MAAVQIKIVKAFALHALGNSCEVRSSNGHPNFNVCMNKWLSIKPSTIVMHGNGRSRKCLGLRSFIMNTSLDSLWLELQNNCCYGEKFDL